MLSQGRVSIIIIIKIHKKNYRYFKSHANTPQFVAHENLVMFNGKGVPTGYLKINDVI